MLMSIAINLHFKSLIVTIKLMMVIDMITNPIICIDIQEKSRK